MCIIEEEKKMCFRQRTECSKNKNIRKDLFNSLPTNPRYTYWALFINEQESST